MPLDITLPEFGVFMQRAGLIKKDPETGIPKAKLYPKKEGKEKVRRCCCCVIRMMDLNY
jgi:hypothetical protein